jgi:hypothetical protein
MQDFESSIKYQVKTVQPPHFGLGKSSLVESSGGGCSYRSCSLRIGCMERCCFHALPLWSGGRKGLWVSFVKNIFLLRTGVLGRPLNGQLCWGILSGDQRQSGVLPSGEIFRPLADLKARSLGSLHKCNSVPVNIFATFNSLTYSSTSDNLVHLASPETMVWRAIPILIYG